ncbi:MAG TPA: DNA methyltransferase [Ktedonobacterales bacterium]|jgi:site-specific DNA-methyltransferase (adenine-specific)
MANKLIYGDNLDVLRDRPDLIPTGSVDLVYLDPPFNSSRSYNVLFKNENGAESDAQIEAFEDTWHWTRNGAEATYRYLVLNTNDDISKMIAAMRSFIGENQMMAYIVMMTARLIELHRVLKPTGSLHLHCDPTASHYLKVILDTIFGPDNFRSDITWKRHSAHNNATVNVAAVTDTILYYVRSGKATFNTQYVPYSESYVKEFFRYLDEQGRRYTVNSLKNPSVRPNLMYEYKGYPSPPTGWTCTREKMEEYDRQGRLEFPKNPDGRIRLRYFLDDMPGAPVTNLWDDIPALAGQHSERLGYPTQKPLVLLERIIKMSTNPGDVVLDPFCGCGTAVAAAQKLDRQWIGIDITSLAVALMKYRLDDMYPGIAYQVEGEPKDMDGARDLAIRDRYQFQWWALSLIKAQPLGGSIGSRDGKKGSDKGVDGVINFLDDNSGQPKRVIVQVKSGNVKSGDIRDLKGVLDREQAAMGIFLTLELPSGDMEKEATVAGYYHSPGWHKDFPRLQILTIGDLLKGNARVEMPPEHQTFKQAQRVKRQPDHAQAILFGTADTDAGDMDDEIDYEDDDVASQG